MFWLIASVILALLIENYYRNGCKGFISKLPGPFVYPFIGNGHLFMGSAPQFNQLIIDLIKGYGNIFRVYILSSLYIILVHPKEMEAILSNNEIITKSDDYNKIQPWLGQGLLTTTGKKWRHYRKFLTPAFHFKILQNFLPIFIRNEKVLEEKLEGLADGREVDLFPIIALHALDNVSESAMGVSINAQNMSESAYVRAVNDISAIIHKRMKNPFYKYDILFNLLPSKKIEQQSLSILHGFTDNVIKNRRKVLEAKGITVDNWYTDENDGTKRKCAFLDLLLLNQINGEHLTDLSIREEVDTFMFEGHDTTTSGICFTLYCISQHQNIQEKLYNEQRTILGEDQMDAEVTYSQLQEMQYLDIVIKETLRLYPSVPIIGRKVTEDVKLFGMTIPKDTNIIMSALHMQRHPDVYENPLEFIPERFLPENISKRNPYSWISFSAGPRNCIGQKFAMLEMKVTVSSILRKFKLQPVKQEPNLCLELILRPNNGLFVKFQKRNLINE